MPDAILAPAKINLHLRVGPVRPDGFHPLSTWMVTVGLNDVLTVGPAGRFAFTCDDPTLPTDGRNLVVKAVTALAAKLNRDPAVGIHLSKKIPAGGGLGGGSSDAAHALMAVGKLWGVGDDLPLLAGVAAAVGSDVPFFLYGPSSFCRGRGERVVPVAPPAVARYAVLVLPEIAMPTAAVYRQFDAMSLGSDLAGDADQGPWTFLPAIDLLAKLANDLEPPAFALEPRLAELRSELARDLDRPMRMSGSGSTLFTLYDAHQSAADAAARLAASGVRAVAAPVGV